jgi:hypothetical protein
MKKYAITLSALCLVTLSLMAQSVRISGGVRIGSGTAAAEPITSTKIVEALGYVPARSVNLPQSQTCDYANGYAIVGYDSATNTFSCAVVGQATPPPSSTGTNFYVATTGNDTTGNGTEANPWRTIYKGLSQSEPGTTINVSPGTYTENIQSTWSGTADKPIIARCTTPGECLVRKALAQNFLWKLYEGTNYNWIIGFDFAGASGVESAVTVYGSHNKVLNNTIHDFSCTDTADYGNCVGVHVVWNGQTSSTHNDNEVSNNVIKNIYNSDRTKKVGQCVYVGDSNNTVANNVCSNVGGYGIQANHYASANKIVNNTIDCGNTSVPEGLMMGVGGTNDGYTIQSTNNVFANNNVTGCKNGLNVWASGGSNFTAPNYWLNNLTYGNTTNSSIGNLSTTFASKVTQSGDLHSDPLYVNKAAGNFDLQSTSPAIGKGTATYAPTTDINGATRATPPNIGAYE